MLGDKGRSRHITDSPCPGHEREPLPGFQVDRDFRLRTFQGDLEAPGVGTDLLRLGN